LLSLVVKNECVKKPDNQITPTNKIIMDIWLIYVIKTLLLPSSSFLLLGFIGLYKVLKKLTLGVELLLISLVGLYILSMPLVSSGLMSLVESRSNQVFTPSPENQAIVVIGSGLRGNASEFGSDYTLNSRTLERVRYAARLNHQTGLPILVSGGNVFESTSPEKPSIPAEATVMADVLEKEFNVPVQWKEAESRNTAENAIYCRKILHIQKVDKILLVTHAFHIKRAIAEFKKVGFEVQAAPTVYLSSANEDDLTVFDLIPSAQAMLNSNFALHEFVGLLWYKIRY
jgi:uncharacterized SAM-binding protein YcdF (DUF218 family)